MGYMEFMHDAQPFMPPFPGNQDELKLLAEYLSTFQNNPASVAGAQRAGIALRPQPLVGLAKGEENQ